MTFPLKSAIAAATLSLAVTAQASEPLKVGISGEPYPPFTFKAASGDWTGFEVDLALALCDAMGRNCEITPTGWSGIIASLNAERIDMIMNSMSITAKRQRVIDFTRPYYFTPGAYVAADEREMNSPEDLDGLVMGVQAATTNATYARRALRDSGVDIRLYNQAEQVNNDLLSGRLDVILADEIAMLQFLDRDEAEGFEIKATAPRHAAYGEGVGIGLRQADDELEASLNDAIATVIEDGTCASLSEQYLGTDVCVYD
ncbi:transporter substrate-binding domain-containing protein [Halomonas saccharevitans]|uniref:Polar amino acid transport system substrate-binding protein n=1 Tax=Halomonas saccharevitans TaxID=416872 RepID=A0A1I6YM71_9GAMM|nr:transporter substrate-binding domain-containing protein [Halomonas saccharevitans]SFT51540.1 polar amino acid transport system substrate-binding protein [Halomonas saccharevitans]